MTAPIVRTDTQPEPKPTLKRMMSDRGIANLFLLPTVLLLVAMNVFPLVWSLYLSFCDYVSTSNANPKWIGGLNYHNVLHDEQLWRSFIFTARFTILSVGSQLLVGFGMAVLLNRTFKAKGILTTLILLPMMLSPVVVGIFWRYMFHTDAGLINFILRTVFHVGANGGQAINWMNTPNSALWAMVIVDTWMWSPFVMLISLAGLNSVPPHLYEAAEVDRASAWFKFRHITMPMVSPLVMIALLFRTMDCFKIFDTVFSLTGGGPGDATKTVSYTLFEQAFQSHQTGYACALAYVILLIIIGLANLYIKYLARVRGEAIPDSSSLTGMIAEKLTASGLPDAVKRPLASLFEAPGKLALLIIVILLGPQWMDIFHFLLDHIILVGAVAVGGVMIWVLMNAPVKLRNGLAYIAIGGATVLYLLPIAWIFITSITPSTDIFSDPPKFVPTHIAQTSDAQTKGYTFGATLENYNMLIYKHEGDKISGKVEGYSDFPGQLINSLFIGGLSTFLAVALGTMAAYAFARFNIKGKGDLLFFVLSTRMMPAIVAIIPIFFMFQKLHLLDTRTGLVILYTVFNLSFSTYLLKGFFDDIPHEYDDAALLDGYSRFQTFLKISLPQALTGIAATAVFCFITAWNEFAFAQILSALQPLTAPPSIVARTGAGGTDWGSIAAGAMIFLIPAALFTFIMRKHLLRGVTFGAIKK